MPWLPLELSDLVFSELLFEFLLEDPEPLDELPPEPELELEDEELPLEPPLLPPALPTIKLTIAYAKIETTRPTTAYSNIVLARVI
mgnify:CR=1 FL=1